MKQLFIKILSLFKKKQCKCPEYHSTFEKTPKNAEFFRAGWLTLAAKAYGGKSKYDFGKIYGKIILKPHCRGMNLSIIDMQAYIKGFSEHSLYIRQ